MAGDVFSKLGDSMSRAITKISVRTSSSLEKSKTKMHIESLTKDVQKMFMEVGEEVYSLWLQGATSTQVVIEKLDAIKQKKAEIEKLSIELGSIDARDNEILGTKTESGQEAEAQDPKNPCCSNCGSECDATAKFCRKCGHKL